MTGRQTRNGRVLPQTFDIDAGIAGLLRSPAPTGARAVLVGVACALVLLVLWKALSLIDSGFGIMILLPAVLIAGLTGGRIAAAAAVIAGVLGGWLVFGLPAGAAWISSLSFILLGGVMGVVAAACRTAMRRTHAASAPGAEEMLEALAVQERRQTFLLMLADNLRDLDTPDAIMNEVERSLGAVLKADRVGYGEVNMADRAVRMTRDWTAGVVSAEGNFSLDALGAQVIDDLADGQLIRVSDVHADPRTQGALKTFEGLQTRALMRAPVIRGGQLRAFLYVHNSTAREWTDAEAELLQDVAVRTWTEIEHSRAEGEIRESEQRFRAIADTAPVLIWVTREDRARAFVNQAYVDYYGSDYDKTVQLTWSDILHPDDRDRILAEAKEGEATGQPFSMEARYRRHDGQYRWLRSFSRPRLNADGVVVGFVGVAFDVTEARQAETDLKRINELLEHRVNEALAEKAKAEGELAHAQRMEAVGRLTGGVAHDFNNLLTVVIGALDILLRSPDDAAKRKKMGEAALAAARRGERLTHQLLAFSRRQTLRPEVVDLSALILDGEPLLKRAVGDAVDLRLDLLPGETRVHIDAAQFEAALLNLVVNARQAVRDGGWVSVQARTCTLDSGDVPDLPQGRYVCVTVSDNGPGMASDVIGKAFEPFFTTKSVGKGTGLGLSQVYGFARQSGGVAHIVSAIGRGAQISLYLPPAAGQPTPTVLEPIEATPAQIIGGRLLLVEDDPGVAGVARELLGEMGLEVHSAATAAQALAMLAEDRFDMMLSDVVMPGGMTGIELARRCARTWPTMKIVLTSGYVGEDVDTALRDSPWPLLRKPYSRDQLAQILGEDVEGAIVG